MRTVIASYLKAFVTVGITLGGRWLSGSYLRRHYVPTPGQLATIQVIAAGILLAATLGVLGWEIQSWKGQTTAEKLNRWLFRVLYVLGTYLFVLSMSWA